MLGLLGGYALVINRKCVGKSNTFTIISLHNWDKKCGITQHYTDNAHK